MQAFHGPVNTNIKNTHELLPEVNSILFSKELDGTLNEQSSSSLNDDDENEAPYKPLLYGSNYYSALTSSSDEKAKLQIRLENESLLKRYYSSKKFTSHAAYRQGSVTSCVDSTSSAAGSFSASSSGGPPGGYMKSPQAWLNKFLDIRYDPADALDLQFPLNIHNRNENEESERRRIMECPAVKAYYNHFQKFLTVDVRNPELLRRHNMWMPTIRKQFRPLVLNKNLDGSSLYKNKISPLFLEGSKYIPRDYDTYGGCTVFPSFFSEYKLPSFCYHCAVEMNGQIFVLGGLVACHKYDEEAPSLKDFRVDGVKNLPPPLLPKIINNPSMINNSKLYVISTSSCRISRPEISGAVPPPLLCMRGSKLTERYIFYYGGFEIKTETSLDHNGICHLKKRAFLNSTGYILDTMTFKFSKVELTALPYKQVAYPTLTARFGHMQMSNFNNHWCPNHNKNSLDCCDNSNPISENESSVDMNSNSGTSAAQANFGSRSNNNHTAGLYTILIFGGYRQTGDDKYEAMNDMWKIEVPVAARGKRGYFKFSGTAVATVVSKSSESDPWPSPRAFFGYSIEGSGLSNKVNSDAAMLKDLKENFTIDTKSQRNKMKSKPIFPNIPHSRRETTTSTNLSPNRGSHSSSVSSLKQSSNTSTASLNVQQGATKRNIDEGKTIVLHGGSNKNKVFSDMWWFDINSETWSNITTFGRSEEVGLISINVDLVGHSMVNVGHVCVCLGGLTQADVDELYAEVECPAAQLKEFNVSNDFLNIFDLTTQCLLGHHFTVSTDGQSKVVKIKASENPFSTSLVMSFGCQVLHINGWIILVGGLVAERSNIKDIYLRGAILECVLPSANLAS